MKKGAIFDMDGLMFDTEQMYQDQWNRIAKEQGIELPADFVREICGTAGEDLYAILRKYYHTEDPKSLFDQVIGTVRDQLKTWVPVKAGCREILEYFRNHQVKLAVASSSPIEIVKSNLKVSGLEDCFDTVVSGAGLPHGKPWPDIFLLAADRLSLKPEECYVFEDAVNGVKAALSAGCTAVMIPDLVEPAEELRKAAVICSSLSEAEEKIRAGKL